MSVQLTCLIKQEKFPDCIGTAEPAEGQSKQRTVDQYSMSEEVPGAPNTREFAGEGAVVDRNNFADIQ